MLARPAAALPVLKSFFCNVDKTEVQVESTDDVGQIIRRQVLDDSVKSCPRVAVFLFAYPDITPASCLYRLVDFISCLFTQPFAHQFT